MGSETTFPDHPRRSGDARGAKSSPTPAAVAGTSPLAPAAVVGELIARARAAQAIADRWTQEQADEAAVAAGWAIVEPARNRALAELAVRDTGLGNVADKIA